MVVEGVDYDINWRKFKKGSSFFIPCVNPVKARDSIAIVLKRLKIKTVSKVCVTEGIKGLRIWRV